VYSSKIRAAYFATVSFRNLANSLTSTSVVSNEHIQRTIDSSSFHTLEEVALLQPGKGFVRDLRETPFRFNL